MFVKCVSDMVRWRLCLGCGACAYACPHHGVSMVEVLSEGLRPRESHDHPEQCECLRACPVLEADYTRNGRRVGAFEREWGPILELWEGHAADPEIRYRGASGGVLTALGLYCLERGGMVGVLHVRQDPMDPTRNVVALSRTRDELLAGCGSRYSPAAVCERLDLVESSSGRCVVIGRPVEIAALENLRRIKPELDHKVGLTLSFFCAEAPSRLGTLKLLEQRGVRVEEVAEIRYRGHGWPGHFTAVGKQTRRPLVTMTYRESWGFLQAYRPWAAHLWPDGTGELADISCGDPWYQEPDGVNPGLSLVVVWTERGRAILHQAMRAGYVKLWPAEHWKLVRSQPGLLRKKGSIWGRLLVLRLCGLPAPRLRGLDLFHCWRRLPLEEKLRSILGTLRRILRRQLFRPADPGQRAGEPEHRWASPAGYKSDPQRLSLPKG